MDQEEKTKIIEALRKKNVKQPCPRCQARNFEVVGQSLIPLNEDLTSFSLQGPAIPSAVIACSSCGFITLHAFGPLGLMPTHTGKEEKQ
jgi:hypothetical protein